MAADESYDAFSKLLFDCSPEGWLAQLGLPPHPVRVENTDVTRPVKGAVDRAIIVEAAEPYALHIEFHSGHDGSTLPSTMRMRNGVLAKRLNRKVFSAAIVLHQDADSPALTGELVTQHPEVPKRSVFEYFVVRLWNEPAEVLLQGAIGLAPLAVLSAARDDELPAVIDQIDERLSTIDNKEQRDNLWMAARLFAGLRLSADEIKRLFRGIANMRESTVYQEILAEGELKGQQKGELKGERAALLRLGRRKLGEPSGVVLAQLEAAESLDTLHAWLDRLDAAANWEDVVE